MVPAVEDGHQIIAAPSRTRMMPTIRLFAQGDIDALVAIALRAWAPVFASLAETLGPELDRRLTPDWRASQEQAVRDACVDENGEAWVAESDGQLVGFLTLSVFDAERAIGEIGMLTVDPEAQAQGRGLALTGHGTARLRQRGMKVAFVETGGDPGHAPARRTYDRAGFTRLPIARFLQAPVTPMDPTDHPHVRTAVLDDLAELIQVYDETRTGQPTDREHETWRSMLATDNLTVYCAQVDGQLVGTATLLVMPNLTYACEPTAFVEAVVVREQWRRQAVATAMMERVLRDARDAGCNKIQLLSHKRHADDGAHRLYENLDFEAEAAGFRRYLTSVARKVMAARNERDRPESEPSAE